MRFGRLALILAYGLWPALGLAQDTDNHVSIMVRLCLAGGRTEAVAEDAGGQLTLRSFDAGGKIQAQFPIDQSSAKAVQEAIARATSHLPPAEADKLRTCLEPVRARLLVLSQPPGQRAPPAAWDTTSATPPKHHARRYSHGKMAAHHRGETRQLGRPYPPPRLDIEPPPQPPPPPAAAPPPVSEVAVHSDAPPRKPLDQRAQMRVLGQELQQLPKGKIYLSAPIEMKVSDKRVVDARVGLNVPEEVLKGHARAGDQSTEGTLRVSHEMVAILSGPGFAITSITPEKQAVAEGFPTVWEWEVEAKVEGAQELEATLYALVPDSPSTTAQQRIDSYTQKINVSVKPQTWGEWIKSTGEEIGAIKGILLSLGAIAAAVFSWFGISRKRQRRVTPPTPRAPKRQVAKTGGKGGEKAA
jgi:hypothetical protein